MERSGTINRALGLRNAKETRIIIKRTEPPIAALMDWSDELIENIQIVKNKTETLAKKTSIRNWQKSIVEII